jgi:hypothetical protein
MKPAALLKVRSSHSGVESNSRLTAGAGALLFVLLAAEGLTVLRVRGLLTAHVFIGMLLIPPLVVKVASTTWRFFRYYSGSPAYRRKGPPPMLLRLLGPAVVVLTAVLFASGIALVLAPSSFHGQLLTIHKASFVLWFAAMTVHVLGHLAETARVAPTDWARRTAGDVAGAGARRWVLVSSVVIGLVLGILMLGPASTYRSQHRLRQGARSGSAQPYPKFSPALSTTSPIAAPT